MKLNNSFDNSHNQVYYNIFSLNLHHSNLRSTRIEEGTVGSFHPGNRLCSNEPPGWLMLLHHRPPPTSKAPLLLHRSTAATFKSSELASRQGEQKDD